MLLLLAGSLVAVSLPGCAGSSGGKSAPRPVAVRTRDASPTLGIVAGKRITKHDVDSVLAYAPPAIRESYMKDPEQFQGLVERIVQQEMLYLAAKTQLISNVGYLAIDLALDQKEQPLVVELNARGGLGIQLARDLALLRGELGEELR